MATQNDPPISGSGADVEAPPPQHRKVAVIIGITGQDGSYLTEFLLDKGYEVHGLILDSSSFNTRRPDHLHMDLHNARVKLHYIFLTDASSIRYWIDLISPDEVYNLSNQYDVVVSLQIPDCPADFVATVALRLLEAMRSHVSATAGSHIRYFQAGSSQMFGPQSETSGSGTWEASGWTPLPLSETSLFHPRSPYAVSSCAAHWYAMLYREAYGLFACNGILFNHESPRRGTNFVTRKITRAVGRIKMGLQSKLFLGNLEATRDWGFAGDYVEAMWMMLQQENPDDYVVATGELHTVEEFLDVALEYVGLDWYDHLVIVDEKYLRPVELDNLKGDASKAKKVYLRPVELDNLKGDASKAKKVLGWKPKVGFEKLVKMMVDEDIELAKREKVLVDTGYMDVSNSPETSVILGDARCRNLYRKRLMRSRSARFI